MKMKKMKESLSGEASGRRFLIKIYDFLRDPVLRALSGGGLGEDSLLKFMISLRNPVPGAQHREDNPLWESFLEMGFLPG